MKAAPCLEDMRNLPGHLHELDGDRKFQLALRLHGGCRLVFEAVGLDIFKQDDSLDWRKVLEVRIVYVGDYHD
jgi:proteic killer suppression protein